MNKQRRKAIEKVVSTLENMLEELDGIREEEQDAYDNLPESIQDSERGETMYENIDTLDTSYADLESIIDNLQELINQ